MKTFFRRVAILGLFCAGAAAATATPFLWSSGGGANYNWSDTANWQPVGTPGLNDSVTFGTNGQSAGEGAADNIVDTSFTIDSLWYAATNISPNYEYHNTQIADGVTLTVASTNAEIVLDSGTQSDPALGKTESYSSIYGNGSLVVTDTNSESVMIVSQGSSTYSGSPGLWAQLDMSGLGWFNGTFGRLLVGVQGVSPVTNQVALSASGRQSGMLSLAITNSIHLTQTGNIQGTASAAAGGPALVINDSPFFGDNGSQLYLGVSNAIWADTITVGRIQCSRTAIFQFNPNFSAPQQLYLRGESSNRVSEIIVADDSDNGGACNAPPGSGIVVPPGGFQVGSAGLFDVSAGSSDIMIDTLIIGKGTSGAGGGYAAGIFNMGAGTLDVNTLQLGVMSSAAETAPVTGTLNIFGGSVTVNSGPVALGVTAGSPVTTYATGSLNITGGSLNVANGAYGINDDGLIDSEVGLTNGTVTVANIGAVSAPIGSLTMADSTLNLTLNGAQGAVVANNLIEASVSSGNVINITSISASVGLQPVITLIQSDNPIAYDGSFTGGAGGSDFVLGTLPAGYQGHLQVNPSSVQLVLTQTPLVLNTWTGADIATHNTNWSDGNNWSSGTEPNATAPAFFATSGSVGSAATINNIVDASASILGLSYINTNGTFQNTWVPAGVTLTIGSGGLTAGSPTVDEGNTTGTATISGPGAVTVNDPSAVIYVALGHSNESSTAEATLDMSGLGNFSADAGSLLVGVGSVGYTSVLQPVGTVYLAKTNDIVVTAGNGSSDSALVALDVGDAGDFETHVGFGANGTSTLYLGETNAIWADFIDVGRQWANGKLAFNPAVVGSGATAYIRGASASAVTAWNIGDAAENELTFGAGSGEVDFTGGSVDALVDTLGIGISSPTSTTATSTETGTLTFDSGVIKASTVNVSDNPTINGPYYGPGQGTINVNGSATLVVSGALNLGVTPGTFGGGTPNATLNIDGGAVWANTLAAGGNGTVSTINMNGGVLGATNGVGLPVAPVTTLNLTNATIVEGAANGPFISALNVNTGGSSNVIQIIALPAIEVYPVTLTVLQSSFAMSGTFNFQVQVPTNYSGITVAESSDHSKVLLTIQSGPVTGRGLVYWVGPTGNNMNWSDAANWFLPPMPAAPDTAYFDNNGVSGGTGSPDNTVDVSTTIAALWYAATNVSPNFGYHNTVINPGVTLTVSNNGADIVFDAGTQTDPSAGTTGCYNTISGTGALTVVDTNTESVAIVSQGSSSYFYPFAGLWASMDMSGLNTFTGTFGRLLLGVQGVGATPGEVALNGSGRQTGRFSLALTNVIHLTQPGNNQGGAQAAAGGPALVVLDSGSFGDNGSILTLGQSNALWADTITVGRNGGLQSGVLQFNPAITGPQQFYLRGESAPRVAEFVVADSTFNPNASQYEAPDTRIVLTPAITGGLNDQESGIVDVSEGNSDIMIDTLNLGVSFNGTPGGYAVGQFNMGVGTLDVNTIQLGIVSSSGSAAAQAPSTGILNVTSGTVTVNNVLDLGVPAGASTASLAQGEVNVTNGLLNVADVVASGSANSEITLSGGTLWLTSSAGSVGSLGAPVGSITLTGGSFLNLAVGSFPAVTANSITASGTSDTIWITSLPFVSTGTYTLIKCTSGAISGYDFALGPALPTGYHGHIQASSDGTEVQLVLTAVPSAPSTGVTITTSHLQGGNIVLSGTNGTPNAVFYVLGSTNLSLPETNRWTVISTNAFDGAGNFNLSLPANQQQEFISIESQ